MIETCKGKENLIIVLRDFGAINDNPDPQEILENIALIKEKLKKMIEHKEKLGFSDVDLEISSLMHQFTYFGTLIYLFYPLERTFEMINQINSNLNSEETTMVQVQAIDFCNRKSFVGLTLFSLETLLDVIAEKHKILFNSKDSITKKYLNVMDFFDIEHGEYKNLLNIFHYTRNSLHSGTKIKKEWGPLRYKGKEFSVKIGQKYVEHTTWNYFTYFTSEIIGIFEKIYQSPKFQN